MTAPTDTAAARQKIDALGARIQELERRHGKTAVPFADTSWQDIVASHAELSKRIADERSHDTGMLQRLHADIEALALSFDSWMKSIDGAYARQMKGDKQ